MPGLPGVPTGQLSYAAAFAEFGLSPAAAIARETVRRRYRELALEYHPDKVRARGGDAGEATAKFQRVCEAYRVLQAVWSPDLVEQPCTRGATQTVPVRFAGPGVAGRGGSCSSSTPAPPSPPSFRGGGARAAASPPRSGRCVACGREKLLITEARAAGLGIVWAEYAGHPERLQSCMLCKMAQRSVMVEDQAGRVFPALQGRHDVFERLRGERRSFTVGSAAHYWLPDLEAAQPGGGAAAAGEAEVLRAATPSRATSGTAAAGGADAHVATPSKERIPGRAAAAGEAEATPEKGEQPAKRDGRRTAGLWTYTVVGDKKLGIRQGPSVDAAPSPSGHLPSGSTFSVSERVCGADGRTYLKLADGRGWTYDRSAKDPDKVVVAELPAVAAPDPAGKRRRVGRPPSTSRNTKASEAWT